jgi:hypothetical protein
MRENRPYGSEAGGTLNQSSLPLSKQGKWRKSVTAPLGRAQAGRLAL